MFAFPSASFGSKSVQSCQFLPILVLTAIFWVSKNHHLNMPMHYTAIFRDVIDNFEMKEQLFFYYFCSKHTRAVPKCRIIVVKVSQTEGYSLEILYE